MDAVIFICICLFFVIKQLNGVETNETAVNNIEVEDTTRIAKINDSYFEDDYAFMDIASQLGFPKGS
ncbi:MAG: hypothetical protein NC548_31475 [Lachnospiraceae bacterium]|nr:hypothetical protein [Lachnospiraceae bacterium]